MSSCGSVVGRSCQRRRLRGPLSVLDRTVASWLYEMPSSWRALAWLPTPRSAGASAWDAVDQAQLAILGCPAPVLAERLRGWCALPVEGS